METDKIALIHTQGDVFTCETTNEGLLLTQHGVPSDKKPKQISIKELSETDIVIYQHEIDNLIEATIEERNSHRDCINDYDGPLDFYLDYVSSFNYRDYVMDTLFKNKKYSYDQFNSLFGSIRTLVADAIRSKRAKE